MADDHDIILSLVQFAPCLVRDWDVLEFGTTLKGKLGYCVNRLVN